ncbi:MAG: hypothetical protein IJC15_02450 [Clostridia bacterium]|nr:hypothetical protein [Clostridia bacterium]
MTKNIRVIDQTGKEYEATYPKRAMGLVKHGRARFIDETTICLACPPNENLEEPIMTEQNTYIEQTEPTAEPISEKKLTLDYILARIEAIEADNVHIAEALSALSAMGDAKGPGDVNGAEKAQAIAAVVEARETTNRQLLQLYERMYLDLTPRTNELKLKAIDALRRAAEQADSEVMENFNFSLDTIRHLS